MKIQALSLLIGTVLPILVGAVTTRSTDAGVKAVLLAFLSALSGFGTELLAALNSSATFDWGTAALTWLATFVTATAVHFGLLKPAGISRFVQEQVGRTDPIP